MLVFQELKFHPLSLLKAIPQLADAATILENVKRNHETTLAALVPNARGALRAVDAKLDEIVVFLSASESHNKKNVNRSVKDSLLGFRRDCRYCRKK